MTEEKPAMDRIHCNLCGQKTKHLLIVARTQAGSEVCDEYCSVSWETIYDLFECGGCEDVTLRRRHFFSEWNPGDIDLSYYPPRIARRLPAWRTDLADEIKQLLEEVYAALQADSRRLSMMGARALIDMVILREVGDVGSFAQKLAKLQEAGLIGERDRTLLGAALDVGNAGSHRGHRPERAQVQRVMDVVEHLLHATILQKIERKLKKGTPKRKRVARTPRT